MSNLTKESVAYIAARLLEKAKQARKDSDADFENDFLAGRREAYYEMLDVLKSELEIADQELKEFGLDINLEKEIA